MDPSPPLLTTLVPSNPPSRTSYPCLLSSSWKFNRKLLFGGVKVAKGQRSLTREFFLHLAWIFLISQSTRKQFSTIKMWSPLTLQVQSGNNNNNNDDGNTNVQRQTKAPPAEARVPPPPTTRTNCIWGQKLLGEMARLLRVHYYQATTAPGDAICFVFFWRPLQPDSVCLSLPVQTHTREQVRNHKRQQQLVPDSGYRKRSRMCADDVFKFILFRDALHCVRTPNTRMVGRSSLYLCYC